MLYIDNIHPNCSQTTILDWRSYGSRGVRGERRADEEVTECDARKVGHGYCVGGCVSQVVYYVDGREHGQELWWEMSMKVELTEDIRGLRYLITLPPGDFDDVEVASRDYSFPFDIELLV